MTEVKDAADVGWKLVVRGLKEAGTPEARLHVAKAILEACGAPLRLREARRRLFLLTTFASKGGPAIVETDDGLVCLMALDDLMEVVMEKGPTLAEVMEGRLNVLATS